jgi:hypothetical protein
MIADKISMHHANLKRIDKQALGTNFEKVNSHVWSIAQRVYIDLFTTKNGTKEFWMAVRLCAVPLSADEADQSQRDNVRPQRISPV